MLIEKLSLDKSKNPDQRSSPTPNCNAFQSGLRLASGDRIRDWDQGSGPGTFDHEMRAGRPQEALKGVEKILEANPASQWSSNVARHMVAFHGLQAAAFTASPPQVIERLAEQSLSPLPGSWNEYVEMTRSFVVGDKDAFDKIVSVSAAPPTPVERSLIRNFGKKTYQDAYMEVVEENRRKQMSAPPSIPAQPDPLSPL